MHILFFNNYISTANDDVFPIKDQAQFGNHIYPLTTPSPVGYQEGTSETRICLENILCIRFILKTQFNLFSYLTCKGQSIIKINNNHNNNNYLKDQKEIKELWVIFNIHDLE